MKRIIAMILGFMMVVSFSGTSQAFMRRDMSLVKGKVLSHDKKASRLTVQGERGEGKMVFDLKGAEIDTAIEKGNRVVVIYKNAGTPVKIKVKAGTKDAPPKFEDIMVYQVTIVKPVPPGR